MPTATSSNHGKSADNGLSPAPRVINLGIVPGDATVLAHSHRILVPAFCPLSNSIAIAVAKKPSSALLDTTKTGFFPTGDNTVNIVGTGRSNEAAPLLPEVSALYERGVVLLDTLMNVRRESEGRGDDEMDWGLEEAGHGDEPDEQTRPPPSPAAVLRLSKYFLQDITKTGESVASAYVKLRATDAPESQRASVKKEMAKLGAAESVWSFSEAIYVQTAVAAAREAADGVGDVDEDDEGIEGIVLDPDASFAMGDSEEEDEVDEGQSTPVPKRRKLGKPGSTPFRAGTTGGSSTTSQRVGTPRPKYGLSDDEEDDNANGNGEIEDTHMGDEDGSLAERPSKARNQGRRARFSDEIVVEDTNFERLPKLPFKSPKRNGSAPTNPIPASNVPLFTLLPPLLQTHFPAPPPPPGPHPIPTHKLATWGPLTAALLRGDATLPLSLLGACLDQPSSALTKPVAAALRNLRAAIASHPLLVPSPPADAETPVVTWRARYRVEDLSAPEELRDQLGRAGAPWADPIARTYAVLAGSVDACAQAADIWPAALCGAVLFHPPPLPIATVLPTLARAVLAAWDARRPSPPASTNTIAGFTAADAALRRLVLGQPGAAVAVVGEADPWVGMLIARTMEAVGVRLEPPMREGDAKGKGKGKRRRASDQAVQGLEQQVTASAADFTARLAVSHLLASPTTIRVGVKHLPHLGPTAASFASVVLPHIAPSAAGASLEDLIAVANLAGAPDTAAEILASAVVAAVHRSDNGGALTLAARSGAGQGWLASMASSAVLRGYAEANAADPFSAHAWTSLDSVVSALEGMPRIVVTAHAGLTSVAGWCAVVDAARRGTWGDVGERLVGWVGEARWAVGMSEGVDKAFWGCVVSALGTWLVRAREVAGGDPLESGEAGTVLAFLEEFERYASGGGEVWGSAGAGGRGSTVLGRGKGKAREVAWETWVKRVREEVAGIGNAMRE
ncbi:hypothetical protein M427DRAFT_44399 [Gonapodya prolifera JEL478]|uniref:Uncharacterized protein n=1 Tax=Gonapodya prolifera (strain JEL478) TaxID=1344416 RepID=A0A139AFG3_GONPJ|nr:hypothetical protein M427DRAFT_44399 [Gonapodya prolifera JEL478]|eukprot:KXS15551.1 hypothetical protein M427DRAFT_44399 [Gonapodya prolifera JEL478]